MPRLPFILGKVTCLANSTFNESTLIHYSIAPRPRATYDCNGEPVAGDYTPNIGINAENGMLAAFESLTTRNFCEAVFTVTARREMRSVEVTLKLILTYGDVDLPPVFDTTTLNANVSDMSPYATVGSYVTTVVAYEPITRQLCTAYSIVSERDEQPTAAGVSSFASSYFAIDPATGVVTLRALPLGVVRATLVVEAGSPVNALLSSQLTLTIDLASFNRTYYSNWTCNPQV